MNPIRVSCFLVTAIHVISAGSFAAASEETEPMAEQAEIKTLEYRIVIAAPVEKVWDTMFSDESYRLWTAPFGEGSYFEGSWSEGERIRFLAPGGDGMLAVIETSRPHEFLSIRHIGYVMDGVEDTTSDSVQSWAPAYENYRFASAPGGTEVTIEHEVFASYENFMNETWPKALAKLKSLCEAD